MADDYSADQRQKAILLSALRAFQKASKEATQQDSNKRRSMILVTGANGQLGTAVVQNLLKKTSADQIVALVRDEKKALALKEHGVDVRVGNYDDTASLDMAMRGVERVLLIAGTDEDKRVQQHQNVVDAAQKAGSHCIVYTSRMLKDRNTLVNQLMLGHF